LNGTLQLGSVDNAESLARKVLDDRLRAASAYLNPIEYEDALSYLVALAWELHVRFDPDKSTQSFSTYAYRILWRRWASWYRQRYGDTRYRAKPTLVSLDDSDCTKLEWREDGDSELYSQINVDLLSPDARRVLERIVEPMVELDLSLEQVADRFGYSRRWVSRGIARLKEELAYIVEEVPAA
jgi:RNA polymerase sigma factor (sigma-70 family)